jgi:broad specificity phosphatase PhoE
MSFFCLRHGEIQSNLNKVYAGWAEEPLTPRGRQQAKEVAKQLISLRIRAIYCSPLQRTMETAEIIGDLLGIKPIPDESFIELRMGPWEGKSEYQISREFPLEWQLWNTIPAALVLDGRETLETLLRRAILGIEKLRREENGGNLLIITHVAIIRVLLLHLQGLNLNLYRSIQIPNCKIIDLGELSRTLASSGRRD